MVMEDMSNFSADGLFAEQWRFLRRLAVNPRRIGATMQLQFRSAP